MNLVYDPGHKKVYCSNASARKVDIIDARADTLIKTIPLGRSPGVLCWNSTNSRVYITDFMDNVVYVLRDTSVGVYEGRAVTKRGGWREATLTRGAFLWSRNETGALLDVSGRKVADVKPGRNDTHALAPGVYTVVTADAACGLRVVKIR